MGNYTNNTSKTLPETGLLRLPQVLQFIPVGKSTWWAGIQSGRFPQGVKLGPRTTAWRCEDIHQFLKDLSNEKAQL